MVLGSRVKIHIVLMCVPSISDSEGAQGAARRELATAKLHRRHPNEHHRAAPGTAGGAKVRK